MQANFNCDVAAKVAVLEEFFSFYVSNSIVFRNFVMDLSVFNG